MSPRHERDLTPAAGPLRTDELIAFFAPSVGEEKARAVVHAAIVRLQLDAKYMLDRVEALAILEALAADPGIVGVAARFTKARILLRRF